MYSMFDMYPNYLISPTPVKGTKNQASHVALTSSSCRTSSTSTSQRTSAVTSTVLGERRGGTTRARLCRLCRSARCQSSRRLRSSCKPWWRKRERSSGISNLTWNSWMDLGEWFWNTLSFGCCSYFEFSFLMCEEAKVPMIAILLAPRVQFWIKILLLCSVTPLGSSYLVGRGLSIGL